MSDVIACVLSSQCESWRARVNPEKIGWCAQVKRVKERSQPLIVTNTDLREDPTAHINSSN
jgi:hypothetical protein